MSRYGGGAFAAFCVDGYNLLPSLSDSVSMSKESLTQQTNAFSAASEEHTPVNLEKGMLTVGNGFFDEVTDELHNQFGVLVGVQRIILAAIEGNIIGKHFMGFAGVYDQKYEVQDTKDMLTKANVTYLVSGVVEEGVIVQNLATFTADWDTKTGGAGVADAPIDYTTDPVNRAINIASNTLANPSVVTTTKPHGLTSGDVILIAGVITSSPTINGQRTVTVISSLTFSVPVNVTTAGTGGSFVKASTNAGGVGYLQETALSGFSGVVPKIMHSVDDMTYSALVTFTTLTTAHKSQRSVVAGVVDRYLSFNGDVTGSGSVTLMAGFSRN